MADQIADDLPFVAETSGCQAQMLLEVMEVRTADVSQLDVLVLSCDPVLPQPLVLASTWNRLAESV